MERAFHVNELLSPTNVKLADKPFIHHPNVYSLVENHVCFYYSLSHDAVYTNCIALIVVTLEIFP